MFAMFYEMFVYSTHTIALKQANYYTWKYSFWMPNIKNNAH